MAAQLKEADWLLAFGWYLNGLGFSLGVAVLFAVTWVMRWPFRVQHIVLSASSSHFNSLYVISARSHIDPYVYMSVYICNGRDDSEIMDLQKKMYVL